ncbi:putative protease [Geothermobacter ehrlichii]|uniref:Putative protease n=1 Tax=Geothermobacter ehrlichii TaxID=213224 RepID=A0A5D3WLA7_9BACT|nr:U32 family peptidase [Geothermobacter ehrlichii]TYO99221.1 putative protease [Geothermobacter ehrlichii]
MTTQNTSKRPELLAPAGSLEAFFAAVEAGADAVYAGLKAFSARAKAKNFSLRDIERMTGYLHAEGRRLYITLNTLVKEAELPELVDTLAALEEIGVDALILQDLAVWRLAKTHFPGLELHASTQMTIHNAAGVRMLERMGFTRAVLARELTLEQIRTIRRQTRLELEHFVHGALCFSFSGQCFFSSYLGGQSGNRGRCTQPCRRRYRHKGKEGYFFSPNDLSAIDLLPQLEQAGICSLKIEGRMKSAEYVHNVVRAYRMVLDTTGKRRQQALAEARELLRDSFGRTPTRGFLAGDNPADIASRHRHGATGRWLGEITAARPDAIAFTTRDPLQIGDRVRVQPASDQPGRAFTVRRLRIGRRQVQNVPAGSQVWLATPFAGFRKGDAVFKVSSRQAFSLSEAACRRRLEQVRAKAAPLKLHIRMPDNGSLAVRATVGPVELERTWQVESSVATENPLSPAILDRIFRATGNAPFALAGLSCSKLPPVVIPPSRLKAIRREFYAELEQAFGRQRQRLAQVHRRQAIDDLLPERDADRPDRGPVRITLVIGHSRDLHVLGQDHVDRVVLPLRESQVQDVLSGGRWARRKESLVWDLPFILFDRDRARIEELIERLLTHGFVNFRLHNLGHIELFADRPQARLFGSYRLFILNSEAARAWRELGLAEGMYAVEDDRDNLARLAGKKTGLACDLTVYARIPLLTSRIPLPTLQKQGSLTSDRGDRFSVQQQDGLTVLSSQTDFSLTGHLDELARLGCRNWTADLSHIGPFSPRGKEVLNALRRPRELPGTSAFNYEFGME